MEAAIWPQEEASHSFAQGSGSDDELPQEAGLYFAESPCRKKEAGVVGKVNIASLQSRLSRT
jgi:hypothetical protein